MRSFSGLTVLVTLGLSLTPAALEAQKRGLQPEDYYDEVAVSEVALSPTGDMVAFTATTILEEENKRHREIWLLRLSLGRADGEPFRFTSPTEESSGPVWSPDGRTLGFRSSRGNGEEDDNATWFLRASGPGGEAYRIEGVRGKPHWSPDGEWIAYLHAPKEEKEGDGSGKGEERKGWIAPNAVSRTLDPGRFDGRVVTSTRYKRDGRLPLQPHYSTEPNERLFVVPAAGGEPVALTDGSYGVRDLVWAEDSNRLFFVADEQEDDELKTDYTTDIYLVSRSGGAPRALTENPGNETDPAVSPDGSYLAFLHTAARGAQTDVKIVALAPDGSFAQRPSNLSSTWDLRPADLGWAADSRSVRFTAGIGGNSHLFEVSRSGGIHQVTHGDRRLRSFSFSRDGTVMAYSVTDAVTPTELYLANGSGSGEQRASHFNDAWLAGIALEQPERLTWRTSAGSQVEGWLLEPQGHSPGRSYPMILKIHGGPHGSYGNTFFRTFHILSARGFYVLYTNPRGSSGYGHDFMYATRGRWGEMDKEDYLGGVDAALAAHPDIDPARIGVSGGSYGGFMTNWLSATTDRFAAAVTSRSIVNWESWYGSSDAQGLTEYEFFGPPWEKRELYRRLSPISYVEKVKIPTLIIHSEQDHRTPIGDGEQWFIALKKQGVPVELVRYPRSSHGLSRTGEPWLLVDRLERLASWFEYWLIDQGGKTDAGGPN